MNLVKTSALSAISTVSKVVAFFITNKLVALFMGPSGLALFGQIQSFVAICVSFSSGATNAGVVKYTAEYGGDERCVEIWATAILLNAVLAVLISAGCVAFSEPITTMLLGNTKNEPIIVVTGICSFFFIFFSFFASVLNGLGNIKQLTLFNMANHLFVVVSAIVIGLVFKNFLLVFSLHIGAAGALLLLYVSKRFFLRARFCFDLSRASLDSVHKLKGFVLMAAVTAVTTPIAHIVVRDRLSNTLGWEAAGYWQAIMRVSDGYLMVITSVLTIYYLPKLSAAKKTAEIDQLILTYFKVFIPISIVLALLVYLLRDLVVLVLFTKEFSVIAELFLFQMVGDVFKMASWVFSFFLVAKAKSLVFSCVELVAVSFYLLVTFWGVKKFGLVGATYAFAVNYIFYFLVLVLVFFWFRSKSLCE